MIVEVPFQQLLTIVKSLTPSEKARLRAALSETQEAKNQQEDTIEFLLNGPVYDNDDIKTIEENRKSIAAWRTKS